MRLSPLSSWRHIIVLALLIQHTMQAQTQSPPIVSYDSQNSVMRFDWQSNTNRTFFPQVSTDLNLWNYAGALHFGTGAHFGMIQSDASKTFLRLRYSDLPVASEAEAGTADFDLDGLSNVVELENTHTDPLDPDTDHDGLPDGWEVAHSISPLDDGSINPTNGPDGEFPNSAAGAPGGFAALSSLSFVTNGSAFNAGVKGHPSATFADKDGDGIPNDRDAGPLNRAMDWEIDGSLPRFIFQPLAGYNSSLHGGIVGCNDTGDVLASQALYSNGTWHPLGQLQTNQPNYLPFKIRVNGRDHKAYVQYQPLPTSVANNGRIVGSGRVFLEQFSENSVGYSADPTQMAFTWDSPTATPRLLIHPNSGVIDGNGWEEFAQIAADGSYVVQRRAVPTDRSNTSCLFVRYDVNGVAASTAAYPLVTPAITGQQGFQAFNIGTTNAFSWLPGETSPVSLFAESSFSTPNPRSYFNRFTEPTYLGVKPGSPGGYCINFWGKTMIRHENRWNEAPELAGTTLITSGGLAFAAKFPDAIQVWKGGQKRSLVSSVVNQSFSSTYVYPKNPTADGRVLVEYFGAVSPTSGGFLIPVEIESKDRFLTGALDLGIPQFGSAQIEFHNTTSGENLGSYKLDGSGGTHIYPSKEDIFSEQELDGVIDGSIGASSAKLSQNVVLWRDGSKVRFATTFGSLGTVEVRLTMANGTTIAPITHKLEADANFSGLIDHLAIRIDSIFDPATVPHEIMPEINGIPDDDDGDPLPVGAAAAAAATSSVPAAVAAASWTTTTRNLVSKALIPVRAAVDGISNSAEATYKISGGFVKGFVDGLCDGVKSDATGIVELGKMALESVTGDFHRAKAMYDGIKTLANLTSEERGAVFDSMLVKFVDKSTTSVPWDPSQMNQADEWGISAYISGYSGGFITEQVVAVMAQVGIVSKAGQGVKLALGGTKLAQLTVAMCQGVRQFVSASFLSVSIHVKVYGEAAVRSVRVMIQEVGQASRNGKTLGEHFYEMMERVTPVKLTFQAIADEKSVIYKTANDWLRIGATGTTIECALAADLGANLTEHGMKGFLNLWKGALRDGATGHYMHHLKNVCTVGNALDAEGLAKILEMFDSTSQSAFKFTPDAQDLAKWISPGGVIYGAGGQEGHRIMHILTHTVPGWLGKTKHTVWSVSRHEVFPLIDEAWTKKTTWVQALDKNGNPDPIAWVCEMGRQVGTVDSTFTKIRVVLMRPGSDEIRSAYSVNSLVP